MSRKGSQLVIHSPIIKTTARKATLPVHVARLIGGYVLLSDSYITKSMKEKGRNYCCYYSETCLKRTWTLHNGNLSSAEKVYSPDEPCLKVSVSN